MEEKTVKDSKKTVKTGNLKHTRCDEGADKDD